jgi:hypothetical protein
MQLESKSIVLIETTSRTQEFTKLYPVIIMTFT